ncbi:glycoside hydrolase family 3 protein [Actinomadura rudentiformis]|uniref:Glycoside hydrolase family 3 protein n=1 Tax=Actinomadura rudentiformis TaxID=359158 RepID=A0A6H9YU29_9ACTN|nr:glycoside hydrolase family 3 N-terminal domain-containing protein [Actinomadura rudentiformis]KAB2345654.1 glycoside hydrolase family 3 protein [Actinomadura rudentiformis]
MSDGSIERLARGTLLPSFPGASAPRWLQDELERGLGGVTLFALIGNVPSPEALAALTAEMRKAADPIITIDEEGGDVTRLGGHLTGSPYPGNAALGAVDDPELTRRVYRSLGAELAEVGVNLNFAPSVDVNTAADNPVIGTRSFGSDPELVARHAVASVIGTQEAGVAACAKHFPGHGATVEDSHLGVPIVDADLALLDRRDLLPFRGAIQAGTQAVMTGHLDLPSITKGVPSTLSRAAITGLLREHLGYQGVIVTDALDMQGASGAIGIPEASVRALLAGADLLCLGPNEHQESLRAVLAAIEKAVRAGRLPLERLHDAAERTRRMKEWLADPTPAIVDRAAGIEAARRALRVTGAATATGNATASGAVSGSISGSVSGAETGSVTGEFSGLSNGPLVVEVASTGNIAVGPTPWGLSPWAPDTVRAEGTPSEAASLLERATGRGLVVVLRDAHRHAGQRALTTALLQSRPDAIVVEMGLPVWIPEGAVHVATYGAAAANAQAAAELLGLTHAP